ncbi:FkbM family methyltransferase [Olleya aquimaris]|uniref:FkbM family methyltransferase n=1 Tax=Olleya sediminilitoris TaxID=2795739 RepID=A0ABS1WKQ7_9FLAO|nr:FkbM family methyltransferase [Olleya sediminilitoris]AXO81593.1 FkbM family methyltransferase [Olleya aquimaris]MBL7559693.1 FkbM family methyltransferase [Olleya sediminilitoris]
MIFLYNYVYLVIRKLLKKLDFKSVVFFSLPSSKDLMELTFKVNKSFSFIQVGANDGVSFDDLYEFVKKRDSKGLVIEPIKKYFNELTLNYNYNQQIIGINKALHPSKNKVLVFKVVDNAIINYPEWVKGIASLSLDHLKKHNIMHEDIEEEEVKADSFSNIIKSNYNFKNLDYLQIDTEGFDLEVLKMFDFSNFKPNIIKYESVNLSSRDFKESVKLLKSKGYYVFKEMNDNIAINLSTVRLK